MSLKHLTHSIIHFSPFPPRTLFSLWRKARTVLNFTLSILESETTTWFKTSALQMVDKIYSYGISVQLNPDNDWSICCKKKGSDTFCEMTASNTYAVGFNIHLTRCPSVAHTQSRFSGKRSRAFSLYISTLMIEVVWSQSLELKINSETRSKNVHDQFFIVLS